MSKLISTFKIGFDDETKAVLSELKDKLDAIRGTLGVSSALLGTAKPNGGLLVAMGEAANDTPQAELKQFGQDVFQLEAAEGFYFAALTKDGKVVVYEFEPEPPARNFMQRYVPKHGIWRVIDQGYDSTYWQHSLIQRQPVNDVDYLSETTPEIQGMEASDIIIDEMGRDYSPNSNCLHAVVPQITQADMQLIFIKNLSDVLIQRMHSMDRFSEDDYHIGGEKLMAWDIVFDNVSQKFGVITGVNRFGQTCAIFLGKLGDSHSSFDSWSFHLDSLLGNATTTIAEAQLPAFRAALEECYA